MFSKPILSRISGRASRKKRKFGDCFQGTFHRNPKKIRKTISNQRDVEEEDTLSLNIFSERLNGPSSSEKFDASSQDFQSTEIDLRSRLSNKYKKLNESSISDGFEISSQDLRSTVAFDNISNPIPGNNNCSMQNKTRPKFERVFPIGVKVMQNLLLQEPYMIPIELLKNNSGYEILLNDSNLREFKIGLIIELLGKSVAAKANDEGVIDLLLITFRNTNFCQKLMSFISEIEFEATKTKYLFSVATITAEFLKLSPANAYLLIKNLVDVCTGVIMHLKKEDPELVSGLEQTFENIHLQVKESRIKLKQKTDIGKNAAPNNYRELEVIPTCEDLNSQSRPYIRENIINGRYENSDHYLDIQFRLLREDFIRPLREGLQEYRKTNQRRNHSVRIYTNVVLDSTSFDRNEYVHYLKLSLCKNFKIENSRRLMYGNILCISYDNFETMIIASIVNRDELKHHLIAVKIETEPFKLERNRTFTVIESRAYFISYKHTLLALQNITEVALEDYFVKINESKSPPDYLQRFNRYKLKIDEDTSYDICPLDTLENWPTCEELKMDESQRRALHGALTRQLAIIQGPPGTGKTYLGLQITKILLQNRIIWDNEKKNPLLVVCYTNHALDQFLEGMLTFTENIIRVGSQSKNKVLANFQINRCLNTFRDRNEGQIFRRYQELKDDIRRVQCIMERVAAILKEINSPGIIDLSSFAEFPSIIPFCFKNHIRRFTMEKFLTKFLTPECTVNEISFEVHKLFSDEAAEEILDLEEEILREEERDRLIADSDEEECMTEKDLKIRVPNFRFQITSAEILSNIQLLINEDDFNNENDENIQMLHQLLRTIKAGQKVKFTMEECNLITSSQNIDNLSFIQRWKLYNYWKSELEKRYSEQLYQLEEKYLKLNKSIASLKDLRYLNCMKTAHIVGMTTTGAAQYCKILRDLAPPIVIVEEAAEIMEAHLVTSLSSKCKHLIIIGDHQQLRPKPNVYELGRKFHLDTSFFERMIKNGILYETLEYQHRMKPVISDLLVPTIYENLKDHPSVFSYPKIKGIQKELFFLDHTVFESPPIDDIESFENIYEAEFLMGLCRHLLYQGYESEDITIITPYLGQHRRLKQLQKRDEFYACLNVRISVLDNYQGEESNIILLSLVRSNEQSKVGFVKIDNRVCVALSRAKHGMYVIGNMSQMSASSDLWKKIMKKLVDGGNVGPELLLECQIHSDQVMKVSSLKDISLKSPEGGCKLPCSAILPKCQHECPRLCHILDQDHARVNCIRPCPKACSFGHTCPKLCFQECVKCAIVIQKLLPCGHEHPVRCSVKPEDFKCPTIVKKELPYCKHEEDMECHTDVKTFKCTKKCVVRLDCGHQCKKKCHALMDPNHESYSCCAPCDKKPLNCEFDHKCRKKCFETCGPCSEIITRHMKCGHSLNNVKCGTLEKDIKCPQKCNKMLSCDHKCPKPCGAECGECVKLVDKIVPDCGHKLKFPCSKTPTLKDCRGKCVKLLPCQHPCANMCKESCCTLKCLHLVDTNHKCPRGHRVKLSCYLAKMNGSTFSTSNTDIEVKTVGDYCTALCGMTLDCGHFCKGKCGDCLNGRLHATCQEKCNKTLVCGHVCTAPCSTDCPPCQRQCLWKCSHSQCKKSCGVLCVSCREQCNRRCPHATCKAKCGDMCTIDPCSQPCPMKLKKCGHDCISYCGEPCPRQCRICDKVVVTEIFFGTEEDEDARFVLLEDCGHIFEGESLDEWMKVSGGDGKIEISMKSCPRCKTPIYSTQRYQNHILSVYNNVKKVKKKHFTNKRIIDKYRLRKTLRELANVWMDEISMLRENLGFDVNFAPKRKQRPVSDRQMLLYEFQLNFLLSAKKTQENVRGKTTKLRELINSLMRYTLNISQQTMIEFSCELRRLDVSVSVEKLRERLMFNGTFNSGIPNFSELSIVIAKIESIMNPSLKFDSESDKKTVECLKEAEKFTNPLGISNVERLQILSAMGLRQGHWYACPNGHVYCITDCGGAVVESVCPECKARIGGTEYRLRIGNRVATEMDGATRSAWPGGP